MSSHCVRDKWINVGLSLLKHGKTIHVPMNQNQILELLDNWVG